MTDNHGDSKKKIKVLHVAATSTGGVGLNILLLSKYLNHDRFELSVAMAPGSSFDEKIKKAGVPVYPVHMSREPLKLSNIVGLYELWKLIRSEKFDIVHTHTAVGGFLGRIVAWAAGVPVILWSIHGWTFNYPFGRIRKRLFRFIEGAMDRITDHYVAVARDMMEIGIAHGVTERGKVSVIHHGIVPDSCGKEGVNGNLRESYGIPENDAIVGTVCRIEPQKAVDDFLRAAAIVRKKVPGVRFLVVGDGPLRGKMEELAGELGIMDRVIFTGWKKNVKDFLRLLDVLCITSLWEAFPFLVLEAMAVETTMVATRVGGIPEIIENGKTGFLVPPGSPVSTSNAIIALLTDKNRSHALGVNARRRLEKVFSLDKMIVQYEKMYSALMQKTNGF